MTTPNHPRAPASPPCDASSPEPPGALPSRHPSSRFGASAQPHLPPDPERRRSRPRPRRRRLGIATSLASFAPSCPVPHARRRADQPPSPERRPTSVSCPQRLPASVRSYAPSLAQTRCPGQTLGDEIVHDVVVGGFVRARRVRVRVILGRRRGRRASAKPRRLRALLLGALLAFSMTLTVAASPSCRVELDSQRLSVAPRHSASARSFCLACTSLSSLRPRDSPPPQPPRSPPWETTAAARRG